MKNSGAIFGALAILAFGVIMLGFQTADKTIALNKANEKLKEMSSMQTTIDHQNELAEGLISGKGYTVTRKEGENVVRYIIEPKVRKEVQMFVPVEATEK